MRPDYPGPAVPATNRMSHSLLYAKSISMLVEEVQAASDMTNVRSSLLRARRFSRSQPLTLELIEGCLVVDGETTQRPVAGLHRLMLAMKMHGVAQLNVSAGAIPRELLKLAMLLSKKPIKDGSTPTIFEEIRNASLWDVQLYPVSRAGSMEFPATHASDVALESADAIRARTDQYTLSATTATRAGDGNALLADLAAIVAVEGAVLVDEFRTLWTTCYDALATPEALRLIVNVLPGCGVDAVAATLVLRRSADASAKVLIEQLLESESVDVRRACFDALIEVRRGTDAILAMLEHEQWFVVRNAACLLGALGSRTSEPELTATLTHPDERVRAAVVSALLQLDTPTSRATVRSAIRDTSPEVRRRAVRGFLAEQGAWTNVDKLLQALGRETELDVQIEFLYAMGTLATPDAVQKLIRLCSIDGMHRPADFRIAAAEALASARMHASVPLLRAMLKDPDAHARAAARHLIRAVS